jgi:hypothetical protein
MAGFAYHEVRLDPERIYVTPDSRNCRMNQSRKSLIPGNDLARFLRD